MLESDFGKILVVDDNEMNRDLLSRRLQRRGYQTSTASGGKEALAAIAAETFDLVLLDIRMPDMDGITVLETIRKSHNKLDLPVLMVTAETDSAQVVRAIGLGANDYVTKPIDFPVVLARVQAQLSFRAEIVKQSQPKPASVVLSASDDLETGFVLDERYEIDRSIGHGGFAVVYRATQLSTGQHVAVKVMRADRLLASSSETEIARFEREMKALGSIQHPNIIRLIDSGHLVVKRTRRIHEPKDPTQATAATRVVVVGTGNGNDSAHSVASADTQPGVEVVEMPVPYLVTELLEGETLKERLERSAPLSIAETIDIMLPVISAVAAAHAESVIHRDLTPANIYLATNKQGQVRPRVLDFGIAKLTGEGTVDLTTTASAIGTPHYMSPEQARGEVELTSASDQYTAGVVIYECLTGRKPYDAESFIALLHMVAAGDFKPPSERNPGIPDQLENVLLKAMSSVVANRYDNIADFGRALLPFASEHARAQWAAVY